MRKLLTILLAIVMTFSAFSIIGCSTPDSVDIDNSKYQLHLGVFNAGYGKKWAEEAIKDFEKAYENYTQPGSNKKGIQVVPDTRKEEFTPSKLITGLPSYENSIYFLNQFDYAAMYGKGYLVDLTDTINKDVYDENGELAALTGNLATTSIIDKMSDELVDFHKKSNGYFAIPWANHPISIIVDGDLLSDKMLYLDENGAFKATQADIDATREAVKAGNLQDVSVSAGPDGELGTADDGFPATYSEFLDLIDKMQKLNITPFTWSGGTSYQRTSAYECVWANYEGYDEFMKNYTLDSYDQTIAAQQGRKAGIQFMYDVMSNKEFYSTNAMTQAYNVAQREFVKSSTEAAEPIAMFFECGYWESEVRGTFDEMSVTPGMGYGERNFKVFPIPNFDSQIGSLPAQTDLNNKEVFSSGGDDQVIIVTDKGSLGDSEIEIAKLFVQFFISRQQLSNFVRWTGACIPEYDFTYTAEELKNYTKYGQDVMRYINEGAKILPSIKTGNMWKNDKNKYSEYWRFNVKINQTSYSEPISLVYNNRNYTVDQIYNLTQTQAAKLA